MHKEMKQEEFSSLLQQPYLFHLHTNYTDGQLEVEDYFRFARTHGVKTIFFTEHVRKDLKYDFHAFVDDIKAVEAKYEGIRGVIAAEAKILPEGDLDISQAVFDTIDVLCFACHGFPDDFDLYYRSFQRLLSDEKWKQKVRVFVHPGRYLKKRHIQEDIYWNKLNELLLLGASNGVYIEDNKREMLPPDISIIPSDLQIVGFDIHNFNGLEKWLNHYQSK